MCVCTVHKVLCILQLVLKVCVCVFYGDNECYGKSQQLDANALGSSVYLFWHLCCSYGAYMCGMVAMCGEDSEDSAFQSIANRNYLNCSAARMMGMYGGVYCIGIRYGWMATIVSIYSFSRCCIGVLVLLPLSSVDPAICASVRAHTRARLAPSHGRVHNIGHHNRLTGTWPIRSCHLHMNTHIAHAPLHVI